MYRQIVLATLALCCFSDAASFNGRIIGGHDAAIEDYPYQLSLKRWALHACGASIISENWALTAAHCLLRATPYDMSLHAGSVKLYFGDDQKYTISEVIVHENFNENKMDYDIALLKVETPFKFSEKVNKIALADESDSLPVGTSGLVSGWGASEAYSFTDVLKAVEIPVVESNVCKKFYDQVFTDRMLCAGYKTGDACEEDRGSPLVYNGKQYGIVSWFTGCGEPNHPGLYTSVPALRKWIREMTQI